MARFLARPLRPRWLVALGLATLLSATVIAIVPVSYPAPALVPVDINLSAGDQFDPHISGDWVSYTSDVGIRYYNFATGIDAAIPPDGSVHDLLSGISGSRIVFSRVRIGSGTAIYVFDAATPAAAPIEIDPAGAGSNRFGSAIGGSTVAYIDFGLEANGELVIHDLDSNVSQRMTDDTAPDGTPAVSPDGHVVTWEHCVTSIVNCDVWEAVKTGATWNVTAVTNSSNPEGNPRSNGTLVVYNVQGPTTGQIAWRPVTGGPETLLETGGWGHNPHIAEDFIAFEGRASVIDSADLFVYDVANNRLFQITNTPLVNEQLSDLTTLPDGTLRLVWSSDEDGADQRNIHGATFQLPNIAPTLTISTESGYGSDGVNPDVGSAATTFTYKVVYTDFEHQAPAYVNVCIDSACHAMTVDAGSAAALHDGDTKNGEQYSYTTTLALGTHDYYFEASDGTASVRWPAAGVLNGPLVSDLAISTTTLPTGTVGSAYGTTVIATGGTPPYHWDSSTLPPGLVMDYTTGMISGTPTTAGTYTFTVFVTDASGAFDSKTVTIVVNPTPTPPVLQVPGTITVNATRPSGAIVTFVVTATDVDPNPSVSCSPASGTLFPIGTTTVNCVATNASGLSARATFRVVVKGAAAQVVDLIALVARMKLRPGADTTLQLRLVGILAALLAGGPTANVCAQLDGFLTEVHAQIGRALTVSQAAQLTAAATQIKIVVGCP